MGSHSIALFDFDGTFTRRDTLMPFLVHCVGPRIFCLGLLQQSPNLAGYLAGMIPNDVAKERLLSRFFRGWEQSKLEELGRIFAAQELPRMVRPEMMSILNWHQRRGDRCYLVSASLDVYLEPWQQSLGFDGAICTRLEASPEGRITGRLQGRNVHGTEKASRIKALLRGENLEITYAYGDSAGDTEMLAMAVHPWMKGRFLGGKPKEWLE